MKKLFLKISFFCIIACQANAKLPPCPAGHCSEVEQQTNQWCVEYGYAGKLYAAHGPNGSSNACVAA